MSSELLYRDRPDCPVCGASGPQILWSGRLDDPGTLAYLDQYHYSGNWRDHIAGQHFTLAQCRACAMKWHQRVITGDSVNLVYGAWADAEQARRFEAAHVPGKQDTQGLARQMAKLALRLQHLAAPPDAPLRLLDFGCGDGKFLRVAKALGADVTGVDVSASRTEDVRAAGLTILPDLDALDHAGSAPFDAVVLSQVLEHVEEPLALLRALRKHLRRGGVLFVAVPNAGHVATPGDFASFTLVQPIEHINAFSPDTLRRIGKEAGFTPLRRPSAFVTTTLGDVLRASVNWVWQPRNTDVFFRATG